MYIESKNIPRVENISELAHVGWGDLHMQFTCIIEGYRNSASELIKVIKESDDVGKLDTYIFPICFLYRNCIELMMKNIILKYSDKSAVQISKVIKKSGHDLQKLWNKVKSIIQSYCEEECGSNLKIAEGYILKFDHIDKKSDAFRYPITKELELMHDSYIFFDLKEMENVMNSIYEFYLELSGYLNDCRGENFDMIMELSEFVRR